MFRRCTRASIVLCALAALFSVRPWGLGAVRASQSGGQPIGQAPAAAPAGPLAPAKYKDVQIMKDVTVEQFDLTMDYFVAAVGLECRGCHERDQATGELAYEKDHRIKAVTRKMINLVRVVNAGDYGGRTNCAQCHVGRLRPPGQQLAQPMTPDEIAAAAQAGRGQGSTPAAGAAAPAGARGAQAPAAPTPAPVDEVVGRYVDALGGREALAKLRTRLTTGTLRNRAGQATPFAIEESGARYRETLRSTPPAAVGFDGASGWSERGGQVTDLSGFALQQVLRRATLDLPLQLKEKFQNLQAARPARIPGATPDSPPVEVNVLQGLSSPFVTEQLSFDTASGLLVRRRVVTRAADRGSMVEQFDYLDYRPVAGVKMPFTIKRTTWAAADTLSVAEVKVNVAIDDAAFARPKR